MNRTCCLRAVVALVLLSSISRGEGPRIDPASGKAEGETVWYDIQLLDVEGQGWKGKDLAAPYDRLPAKAEKQVRGPVWGLSRDSTGICVRFVTDAPTIDARWKLTKSGLAMPHMPATGVSGLDLYARADKTERWQWVGVGRPTQFPLNTARLASALPKGPREFLLYLPLYNGVTSVEIGLPKAAVLSRGPARPTERQKPIVFYGTSITQGGCASRPGMVHTAILQRRFERPVINLGFSGNGRMEPEVARLLAEIDAAVYVLDCLPNMTAKDVEDRTAPVVKILREAHPDTPILLVEDRSYANSSLLAGPRERNSSNRAALKKQFEALKAAGVKHLHYLGGEHLIGDDGEGTVDGSHPTDLGFQRQAEVFAEALAPLLPQPTSGRAAVEGYTDQLSYVAGDTIRFHISSEAPNYRMEITRVGPRREVVWQRDGLEGKSHPVPSDASSRGCRWPVAFSFDVPLEWRTGYYTARMEVTRPDGKKAGSELFFVVRPAVPGKDTRILLQLSTNTYNAYCNWGGYSLYAYNGRHNLQGRRVSFDRPIAGQFSRWEQQFVQWAEAAGYKLDYAVNSDLEFHPELLKAYKLVLSVGHDEYWSAPMRDHLEAFIAAGGNVAFLSGNTCCWQVRSEDHGRALACWKQTFQRDPLFAGEDHRLLSTLWSHYLVKRPENQLTGVGFLYGGYHRSHGQFMDGPASFIVHRPDHWLFEGTGMKRDDRFGGKDTIVGYECDGCEFRMLNGLPEPTHRDGTPENFTILATCPARWHPDDSEWYERWEKGRTGAAVLGTYTRGGTVVTVGSTDWSHGLAGKDPTVIRITRNILDRLGS